MLSQSIETFYQGTLNVARQFTCNKLQRTVSIHGANVDIVFGTGHQEHRILPLFLIN